MTSSRYLPADHYSLDLYAEEHPEMAEQFSQTASSLAIAEGVSAREMSYYYGFLREARNSDS
jgi:hypothetical protein